MHRRTPLERQVRKPEDEEALSGAANVPHRSGVESPPEAASNVPASTRQHLQRSARRSRGEQPHRSALFAARKSNTTSGLLDCAQLFQCRKGDSDTSPPVFEPNNPLSQCSEVLEHCPVGDRCKCHPVQPDTTNGHNKQKKKKDKKKTNRNDK
uniref:C3H1-type domain-containing protein n=1 Tax=Mesocestoides corti TaxID=53468 RepID=A0A5K3FXF7_MESCO